MITRQRTRQLFAFAVFIILASLDNAAAGVLPPLYAIIARDLQASDAALGAVTAVYLLIVAAAACASRSAWCCKTPSSSATPS